MIVGWSASNRRGGRPTVRRGRPASPLPRPAIAGTAALPIKDCGSGLVTAITRCEPQRITVGNAESASATADLRSETPPT
jgi:hypothetical protein